MRAVLVFFAVFLGSIGPTLALSPEEMQTLERFIRAPACTVRVQSGYLEAPRERAFVKLVLPSAGRIYWLVLGSTERRDALVLLMRNSPPHDENVYKTWRIEDFRRAGMADRCSKGAPPDYTEEKCTSAWQALYREALGDVLEFVRAYCSPLRR